MGILDDAIREHLELKRRRGADGAEVSRQEREILGQDAAGEGAPFDAPAADLYDDPVAATDPAYADDAEGIGYADPIYDEPAPQAPLAGSPLAEPEPELPADPAGRAPSEIFPGTGELLAAGAASADAPPAPAPTPAPAPAPPAESATESAERTGARRLSDEELAAWRKRLSDRADRLAAGRPGATAAGPAASGGADAAARTAPRPAAPAPTAGSDKEPPAYWSGNTTPPPATPAAGAAHTPPPAPEPGVPVDFFDAGEAGEAFSPEPAPAPVDDAAEGDVLDETPDFLQETPEHDRMWFEQRPPRDFDFG